jgi:hypothetical protein
MTEQGASRRLYLRSGLLASQLAATLLVLALLEGNLNKLIAFVLVWSPIFWRASIRQWIVFVSLCCLFSIMDIMAVRQGVFRFTYPDVAGLPIWEFLMWGYIVLHILLILDGPVPKTPLRLVLPLAIVFALPFATVTDPSVLLVASGVALGISLLFFHEPLDFLYLTYAVILGAIFEYTGVWSGQWSYPGDPPGGVAFWFVTMWAGVGLFARRLLLPLLSAKHSGSIN